MRASGALPQATVDMAYGQKRTGWRWIETMRASWVVAPGYGGYGLQPKARGLGCVLRRGPQATGGIPQLPS